MANLDSKFHQFLNGIGKEAGYDMTKPVNEIELGRKLGLQPPQTLMITQYLKAKGYIKQMGLGGKTTITHQGLKYLKGQT